MPGVELMKALATAHMDNQRKADVARVRRRRKSKVRGKGKIRSKAGRARVSSKISHLVKAEGKPHEQAVAMALNMERAGRLGPRGGYRRVGR